MKIYVTLKLLKQLSEIGINKVGSVKDRMVVGKLFISGRHYWRIAGFAIRGASLPNKKYSFSRNDLAPILTPMFRNDACHVCAPYMPLLQAIFLG